MLNRLSNTFACKRFLSDLFNGITFTIHQYLIGDFDGVNFFRNYGKTITNGITVCDFIIHAIDRYGLFALALHRHSRE